MKATLKTRSSLICGITALALAAQTIGGAIMT